MFQKEGTAPKGAPGEGEQDRFQKLSENEHGCPGRDDGDGLTMKRAGVDQRGLAVNHHACLVSCEESPARSSCLGSGAWGIAEGVDRRGLEGKLWAVGRASRWTT